MASPTTQCLKRLQIELRKLNTERDMPFQVGADPNNMLRCYFVMDGPEGTPYEAGRYIGLLEVPPDYPFKPPSVQLCTPSGRFRTGMPICLSNSSYHPEQWSPMWGLRTILLALVSFFVSEEKTSGSTEATPEERRRLAADSRKYNVERLQTVYKRVLPAAYADDLANAYSALTLAAPDPPDPSQPVESGSSTAATGGATDVAASALPPAADAAAPAEPSAAPQVDAGPRPRVAPAAGDAVAAPAQAQQRWRSGASLIVLLVLALAVLKQLL